MMYNNSGGTEMTVKELIVELQKIEDKERGITVYDSDKCKFGDIESVDELEFEDGSKELVITLPYMSSQI
jgi:hypothetical protein